LGTGSAPKRPTRVTFAISLFSGVELKDYNKANVSDTSREFVIDRACSSSVCMHCSSCELCAML
jgi:hypothetical protein